MKVSVSPVLYESYIEHSEVIKRSSSNESRKKNLTKKKKKNSKYLWSRNGFSNIS